MVLAPDRAAIVGLVLEAALWGKHSFFYRMDFDLIHCGILCRLFRSDVFHHYISALSQTFVLGDKLCECGDFVRSFIPRYDGESLYLLPRDLTSNHPLWQHVVVMANHVITGFITSPVGPVKYFSRYVLSLGFSNSNPLTTLASMEHSTVYLAASYLLQTMLGDAVVVRLFLVIIIHPTNVISDIPMLCRVADDMGCGGTNGTLVWDGWYVIFANTVS
jgi:hypothetical protein